MLSSSRGSFLQRARKQPPPMEVGPGDDQVPSLPPAAVQQFEAAFWCDEDGARARHDDLLRIYTAAAMRADQLNEELTDADLVQWAAAAGFQIPQSSLQHIARVARVQTDASLTGHMPFKAFARAVLLLAATSTRKEELLMQPLTATYDTVLATTAVQWFATPVEQPSGMHRSDVRRVQGIDDLLYVYWKPIHKVFDKYRKRKKKEGDFGEQTESPYLDVDDWFTFAKESWLSKSLTKAELLRVAKVCNFIPKTTKILRPSSPKRWLTPTQKEEVAPGEIPERPVQLNAVEFMNCLARCALAVLRLAPRESYPSAEHKLLAVLNLLFGPGADSRFGGDAPRKELLWALPTVPPVTAVDPPQGSATRGTSVAISGTPLCHRRGSYLRWLPGLQRDVYVPAVEGSQLLHADLPPFPEELRFRSPPPDAVARRERWATSERRRVEREGALHGGFSRDIPVSPRKADPVQLCVSPPIYDTHLAMEPRVERGKMSIHPVVRYTVDVQLSNDGRHFSEGSAAGEFTFVEELGAVAVPLEIENQLRKLFEQYCRHEDAYNEVVLTQHKWTLFKHHYKLVEPPVPIYAPGRRQRYETKVQQATVAVEETRRIEDVLQSRFHRWIAHRQFSRLPKAEFRNAQATLMGARLDEPLTGVAPPSETLMHRPGVTIAEGATPSAPFGDPLQVTVNVSKVVACPPPVVTGDSPVFDEMADGANLRGRAMVGVCFPNFVALICRVYADLYGDCSAVGLLQRITAMLDAGRCLLPPSRRPPVSVIEAAHGAQTEIWVDSLPRRPRRQFGVFDGAVLLGRLTEGPGIVGPRRRRSNLCGWTPAVSQCHSEKIERAVFGERQPPCFDHLLLHLQGSGLLLGPLPVDPRARRIPGRCYEVVRSTPFIGGTVSTARRVRMLMDSTRARSAAAQHLHQGLQGRAAHSFSEGQMNAVVEGRRVVAHLWDFGGTCATPWWQAADGEIQHPEAAMMVYGRDPHKNFYPIFAAFARTRFISELRARLIELGMELWPVAQVL